MKSAELLKDSGYKKRYNDSNCVIYDLIKKQPHCYLPESIIIRKGDFSIEFTTENAEKYTHLGACSFQIGHEVIIAINEKIEELKAEKSNKYRN